VHGKAQEKREQVCGGRFSQEALVAKQKKRFLFSLFFPLALSFQRVSTLRQRGSRNPYGKPMNGGEGKRYETGDVEG